MGYSKKIIQLLAIMLIVTMVAFFRSAHKNKVLQANLDRQTQNVASLSNSIKYDKVEDSLSVAKHTALQAKYDELQKLHLADTKVIKDLKVKLKDADVIHTVATSTTDTVFITPVKDKKDSVFAYNDKWLKLYIDIPSKQCQYTAYDSLTTIVSRTYKHRFLWWRWGTKGYQVQIINFNPHAKVNYSRFIKVSN